MVQQLICTFYWSEQLRQVFVILWCHKYELKRGFGEQCSRVQVILFYLFKNSDLISQLADRALSELIKPTLGPFGLDVYLPSGQRTNDGKKKIKLIFDRA